MLCRDPQSTTRRVGTRRCVEIHNQLRDELERVISEAERQDHIRQLRAKVDAWRVVLRYKLPSEAISFWSSMLETDEKIFRLAVAGAYALGVDEALADRATRYHMAKSIIGYAPELPEDHDQLLKCWFVGIWELAAREIKSCEDGSDAFSKLANQEWTSWYEEEYMPVWCEYTDAVLLFAYYAGKESIEAMGVHV